MEKIVSVLIICRERPTNENDIYYAVGYDKVTKIEKTQRCGDGAMIDIYNIYRENNLIATVEHPDEITYSEE
jgi:hypothetical protein